MKRRLRALLRARVATLPSVDMLIEIRTDIRAIPFPELGERLDHLLARAGRPC